MKLPKTIKIGGFSFKIIRYRVDGQNDIGWIFANKQELAIADNLPEETQEEALLHELLHGAWWQGQLNKFYEGEEEKIVSVLSIQLYNIFRDNPKLKECLFE